MKKYVKSALIASTMIVAGAALAHDGPMGEGMGKGMAMGPGGQGMMGMQRQPVDIAKILNLDAARADKVNAILADERKERQALWETRKNAAHDDASKQAFREKMMALREGTKTKLQGVLTADELKTLRESMHKGDMHRGGMHKTGMHEGHGPQGGPAAKDAHQHG